jgi:hypothetical protein
MTNIQLCDLIYEYCRTNKKYLVHYKLNYTKLEEKDSIIEFYTDKINDLYLYSMKNQDEGFFEYDDNSAELEAQLFFPTNREIYGEYGENSPLYVSIWVYNKDGICVWENILYD